MKKEFIYFIEKDLDKIDINRMWTLLQNCKLNGIELVCQIEEWKTKLINKKHIEGTPWNISKNNKNILIKQWLNLKC